MRKKIAKFLILLMLFSNAAWAMDSSATAFFGHGAEQVQIDNDSDSHPHDQQTQQDLEHSDHCCHGAAHLIGITSIKLLQIDATKDVAHLQAVTILISFNNLPPTPPPTV